MTLAELRAAFANGKLAKPAFIDKMNDRHRLLHEYVEILGGTGIAKIELSSDGVMMTTQEGVKLLCEKDDKRIAPLEILNFGAIEPAEMALTAKILRDGQTVFDVGANIGWYSVTFAKKFPKARFHAFEPIPSTFKALERHLALNGARNVTPHALAFGDDRGKKRFYFYPEGSVNASAANLTRGKSVRPVSCKIERLDDFVRRRGLRVDFIKCDVEGGELFVFRGGVETLARDKPAVYSEMLRKWSAAFGYHPNEIIELFSELGYRCFAVRKGKLAPFKTMTDATRETNFFFLHPARHARDIARLRR